MTVRAKGDTAQYDVTSAQDQRDALGVVIMSPTGGASMVVNPNGRAAAASSTPVVLATEDNNAVLGVTAADWTYAAAASGIVNTTTAVTFKTAAGAGLRNYITGIQITADALGAATELAIRDGAAGAVLWRIKINTAGLLQGIDIEFKTPLRGTANTLLEVVTLTASVTGAVYFNAQGFAAL
jgi:hypothetical protein